MKLKNGYFCLFLCLITLVLYYPLIFAPFNSVDDLALVNYLLNLDSFSLTRQFFPGGEHNYYRPVLMLSYVFDQYLWGGDASFMHLENVLLHLFNVLLVYCISINICRILSLENKFLPFFSSLVFAIHPINVEAIAWVVGRTDLLAGFFVFLSFLFLLFALRFGRLNYGLFSAMFFFLGCLSKETALFFIPGALLFIFLPKKFSNGCARNDNLFRTKLFFCFGFPVLFYFMLRFIGVNSDRGMRHVMSFAEKTLSESVLNSTDSFVYVFTLFFKTCGFYLKKLLMPLPLNFGIVEIDDSYVILGLILGMTILYFLGKRNMVNSLFLMSVFLGSSALLAAFTGGMWTPFAERYMYIPCAPFVIGITLFVFPLIEKQKKVKKFIFFIFLPIFLTSTAYATFSRCLIWLDNETLFRDTVNKSPSFNEAKNELAIALQKKGKIEEYLVIRRNLNLDYSQAASLNTALLKYREGDSEGARRILLKRLETTDLLENTVLELLIKISMVMIDASTDIEEKTRLRREVLTWLGRLYELTGNPFYCYRIGTVYLQLNEFESAQRFFAKAAATFPENSIYKKPSEKLAERLKKP